MATKKKAEAIKKVEKKEVKKPVKKVEVKEDVKVKEVIKYIEGKKIIKEEFDGKYHIVKDEVGSTFKITPAEYNVL